jgi:hypothetical protein
MSALPRHYQTTIMVFIRFVLVMLVVALVMGILYAESAKKVPMAAFGVDVSFHANYFLSLLHGHTFMFGVFIPLAVIALLVIPVVCLHTQPLTAGRLKWVTGLYILNAIWSLGLLVYKAYATQLAVRGGNLNMVDVDHLLFGANHTLRVVIYALPHTLFAAGLVILVGGLWRSLKTAQLNP